MDFKGKTLLVYPFKTNQCPSGKSKKIIARIKGIIILVNILLSLDQA